MSGIILLVLCRYSNLFVGNSQCLRYPKSKKRHKIQIMIIPIKDMVINSTEKTNYFYYIRKNIENLNICSFLISNKFF